jgi:hypothetical protein
MICSKCGFGYVEGDEENEKLHEAYCDKVRNGPPIHVESPLSEIWRSGMETIVVVTHESPREHKDLAQDVSRVANKEMGYDEGIYRSSDPPDERKVHIYIYALADRSIGILLFELREHVWLCCWNENAESPDCVERPDIPITWSVGFLWVHERHRTVGNAGRLLRESS